MNRKSVVRIGFREIAPLMAILVSFMIFATSLSAETAPVCALGDPETRRIEDRLLKLFSDTDRMQSALPKGHFDVAARQRLIGSDIEHLFAWVRDETVLLPYEGVLRGARGVLMDRGGSSLDRSLLLIGLLEAAGHTARLARSDMDTQARERLRAELPQSLPTLEQLGEQQGLPGSDMLDLLLSMGLDIDDLDLGLATDRRISEQWILEAQALAARQAIDLQPHLHLSDNGATEAWEPREHWWVQVERRGQWQDLDPALPEHRPGDRLVAGVVTSLWPEELEDPLHHRLSIQVQAEQLNAGRINEHLAFETTLRVADLHGQHLRLRLIPLGLGEVSSLLALPDDVWDLADSLRSIEGWVPVLNIGREPRMQMSIQADGTVSDQFRRPGVSRSMDQVADVLGGLSVARGRRDRESAATLSAVFIDYVVEAPGRPKDRFRRSLMDMLDDQRDSAARVALDLNDELRLARAVAMMSGVEILPQTNWWPVSFSDGYALHGLQENRVPLLASIQAWAPLDTHLMGRALEEVSVASAMLSRLATMRRAASKNPDQMALTRVNLLTEYEQSRLVDGQPVFEHGIDIIDNRVAVLEGVENPSLVRLYQGVLDTVLEALVLSEHFGEPEVGNAALAQDANRSAGISWQLVDARRSRLDEAWRAQLPPEAQLALDQGLAVIAPPPDQSGRVSEWWWRLDRQTGDVLGIGREGRGQVSLQYALDLLEAMNNGASGALMAQTIMACVWDARNPADPRAGANQALCCTAMAAANYAGNKLASKATGKLSASYARSLELSKMHEAALNHIFGTYVDWAQDANGYYRQAQGKEPVCGS